MQSLPDLRLALDAFYPGRLAAFFAFERNELHTTSFRETLERQSGMYRIAAQIDEEYSDRAKLLRRKQPCGSRHPAQGGQIRGQLKLNAVLH